MGEICSGIRVTVNNGTGWKIIKLKITYSKSILRIETLYLSHIFSCSKPCFDGILINANVTRRQALPNSTVNTDNSFFYKIFNNVSSGSIHGFSQIVNQFSFNIFCNFVLKADFSRTIPDVDLGRCLDECLHFNIPARYHNNIPAW
jgi:hypothetical protein